MSKIISESRSCATCIHARFYKDDTWLTGHPRFGICTLELEESPPHIDDPHGALLQASVPKKAEIRWIILHAGEEIMPGLKASPPSRTEYITQCVARARANKEYVATNNASRLWWDEEEQILVAAAENYYDQIVRNLYFWLSNPCDIIHYNTTCHAWETKNLVELRRLLKKPKTVLTRLEKKVKKLPIIPNQDIIELDKQTIDLVKKG